MVSAIVLAAGLSSRMGKENKLLLRYKDKPIITTVVESILQSGIDEVILVLGHEAELVKTAVKNLPVLFTHNLRYAQGMTTSIQQGVTAAKGNGYMICLSDMVKVTPQEYRSLKDGFEKILKLDAECICLPCYNNEKGNPVIFSAFYKDAILQNQDNEGCKNIVQKNKKNLHLIEMKTPHILLDLDYPEDFKKL